MEIFSDTTTVEKKTWPTRPNGSKKTALSLTRILMVGVKQKQKDVLNSCVSTFFQRLDKGWGLGAKAVSLFWVCELCYDTKKLKNYGVS